MCSHFCTHNHTHWCDSYLFPFSVFVENNDHQLWVFLVAVFCEWQVSAIPCHIHHVPESERRRRCDEEQWGKGWYSVREVRRRMAETWGEKKITEWEKERNELRQRKTQGGGYWTLAWEKVNLKSTSITILKYSHGLFCIACCKVIFDSHGLDYNYIPVIKKNLEWK